MLQCFENVEYFQISYILEFILLKIDSIVGWGYIAQLVRVLVQLGMHEALYCITEPDGAYLWRQEDQKVILSYVWTLRPGMRPHLKQSLDTKIDDVKQNLLNTFLF